MSRRTLVAITIVSVALLVCVVAVTVGGILLVRSALDESPSSSGPGFGGPGQVACSGFSNRWDPQQADQIVAKLGAAGLGPATSTVIREGETCGGQFQVMNSRYEVTATVRTVGDDAALGADLDTILGVVLQYAEDFNTTLTITAKASTGSETFRSSAQGARDLRTRKVTGAALVAALRANP